MSSTTPLPIRLAQVLGITSSLFLAGMTTSLSVSTVPRLLESPASLLLRQWGHLYDGGKKTGPPVSLVAGLAYFFLAYRAHVSPWRHGGANPALFAAAAALSLGIVPYTLAVLARTNRALLAKVAALRRWDVAGQEGEGEGEGRGLRSQEDESAHQLVDRWALLNLGRAGMLLASGLLGVWGVVG